MAGNVDSIIDTIDAAQGRRMHLAHIQFYGYADEGKRGFSSGALRLAEKINKNIIRQLKNELNGILHIIKN